MSERLTRQHISDAVSGLGWRLVLETVRASVPVPSVARAAEVAALVVAAAGADADEHVHVDVRADQAIVTVRTPAVGWLTPTDLEIVARVTDALAAAGLRAEPGAPVQLLEIAIDAIDIPAVRPFWKAVLGYADWLDESGALADPRGHGPTFWFQQMDEPRPQRNRIHFDVSVPHDEAESRIAAAVAAGGAVIGDEHAPAFWVLADPEGNEACVTTWQGRDRPPSEPPA